jgi:hypothetical protein
VSALRAVDLVDDLYRRAIQDPAGIDDRRLAEWMEQAGETVARDRRQARSLRAAVRTARKLARYWSQRDAATLPDWRNGVDEALGGRGWQVQLDLVTNELDEAPSPDLFEEAKRLHRSVHFTAWMEGVAYEDWLGE